MSAEPRDHTRLATARLRAIDQAPYLAVALLRLRPVAVSGLGTVAVDEAWRLYVDHDATDQWNLDELAAALIHEVHHLLRGHAARRPAAMLPLAWNVVADLEINDDLARAGLTLPAGSIYPHLFGLPPHLTAERYAELLDERGGAASDDGGCDPGAGGGDEPGDGGGRQPDCGSGVHGAARPYELPDDGYGPTGIEVEGIRQQVAAAVRGRGDAPAGLRRWAEELLDPALDWATLLARAVGRRRSAAGAGNADWTWRRTARRQPPGPGPRLPRLAGNACEVAIVIDTSGSITATELAAAVSEVLGAVRAGGYPVTVLACDTEVTVTSHVTRPDQVVLTGGGGTDMRVAIDHALELRPQPDLLVVITDGETPWPDTPPTGTNLIGAIIGPASATADAPAWLDTVTLDPRAARRS